MKKAQCSEVRPHLRCWVRNLGDQVEKGLCGKEILGSGFGEIGGRSPRWLQRKFKLVDLVAKKGWVENRETGPWSPA